MSLKTIRLPGKPVFFLNKESDTENVEKIKSFFKTEDLEQSLIFELKLEDFLFHLYTLVPMPESPLKAKAHERLVGRVAEELRKTVESETLLPVLSKDDLALIKVYVDDPEHFTSLQIPFTVELLNGEKKNIPIPSKNILTDYEFVASIDTIFSVA